MPLLILAIILLFVAIILIAYGVSRKENKLTGVAFLLLIVGIILLFIAAGWKWGLVGLIASLLIVIIVSILPSFLGLPGHVSPSLVKRAKEVGIIGEQHKMEIEDFWDSTSPEKCASLMVSFLDELRRNWLREFSQLNPDKLTDTISEELRNTIKKAYIVGYMSGKGWISQEQVADFNLLLGDTLAYNVKTTLGVALSSGIALASAFTTVAAQGHIAASGQYRPSG